jgi:two-component system sensor histidine kinase TrcS
VQSRAIDGEHTLVSGVSLERANEAVVRKSVSAGALVLVALVVCAAGTVLAIRVALRPLRRVAATAAGVAKLPLADPGHRITARVADVDTDPDNEVGIVGRALNRLLTNVDSALVERAESDRRIRRFLSDASHELRTPLAAIQGYAELTRQDRAELPDTTEYALARIESESRRMASLVADLLLLSRLDERQGLLTEDVDLSDVLIDAVNDIGVSATDHHWHLELPEIPVRVVGDRARLHQLLSNLLVNASIHTPPGTTVTTSLRIRADDGGAVAEVAVEDDGPGIPADVLPHLFDRFVRADTSRSREVGNSGLGLAIVQSIAEAHNGSVAVRSDAGGTRFTVDLPDLVLTYSDFLEQRLDVGTP